MTEHAYKFGDRVTYDAPLSGGLVNAIVVSQNGHGNYHIHHDHGSADNLPGEFLTPGWPPPPARFGFGRRWL